MKKELVMVLTMMVCGCTSMEHGQTTVAVESFVPQETSYPDSNETRVYENLEMIENGEDLVVPFNSTISLETLDQQSMDLLYPIFDQQMTYLAKLFDGYNQYTNEDGSTMNNLYMINAYYGTGQTIELDEPLYDLLKLSMDLTILSDGSFNPTIGALSNVWKDKFTPFPMENTDPSEETIDTALTCVVKPEDMMDTIVLDDSNHTVTFNTYAGCNGQVILDLGGIAKGYAVDLVSKALSEMNQPFILNGGTSSILAYTPDDMDHYWYVGVRDPYARVSLSYDVQLTNTASFTSSGDDGNYFLLPDPNGDGYIIRHHILDPISGYPHNSVRMVTLVSTMGTNGICDALSTALFNIDDDTQRVELIKTIEEAYGITIEYSFLHPDDADGGTLSLSSGFDALMIEDTLADNIYEVEVLQ